MEKPIDELTVREREMRAELETSLTPELNDIVKQSDKSVRLQAVSLLEEINELVDRYRKTEGYRNQINYA